MIRLLTATTPLFTILKLFDQSLREICFQDPKPNSYFGIIAANGKVSMVSSPGPCWTNEVALNGGFDICGPGPGRDDQTIEDPEYRN